MKRVFIIHGWGGDSNGDWLPWLKKELEARHFEVHVPDMPDTDNPKIGTWVNSLKKEVGQIDEDTYLVGHSIGCQTIMRFLAEKEVEGSVGGVILVAPWFTLMNLEEGEDVIAEPWFNTTIDYSKIKNVTKRITTIFSDNDQVVPFEENVQLFKERLDPDIIILSKMGHFNGGEGVVELPIVLEKILEMTK